MVGKPKTAEMHAGPGFRIRYEVERPTPEMVEAISAFETPIISDLMNRLYTMAPEIRSITDPNHRICGAACTVRVYPGDNLMVHKALDVAGPGDVLVVNASGSRLNGVMGDLVATKARHRKLAGFVVDGFVRDLPGIMALGDFPVFARGVTPIGPLHRGPGEINHAIAMGGVVVNPGDVVIGDPNGVVVVPRDVVPQIVERLRARTQSEAEYSAAVARGDFSNDWVDALLVEGGLTPENPSGL